MFDSIKVALESILGAGGAEILLRTICVLIPAEGLRIILRGMILHPFVSKAKAKLISEQFGFLCNIGISCLAAWAYSENKDPFVLWYEGFAYGFATVFVHWSFVKYEIGDRLANRLGQLTKRKKT